ncbi:hypothetical protein DSL64_03895 [Dyadobacter luteus]|uniref:PLOD1-3-like GT domain-containing protein n=1 Tax=Dyadobacter luteus TaxID=2259619 RepID=A0A3D8YFZ4_9BACT|nr:glycosyltransferase domain-containing protein [Dyadobacter luteus]REA63595.1 hypothetical protein DSL64_03895 [Dyadobacter luteus]
MIKVVCCISDFGVAGYRNGLSYSCRRFKINLTTLFHSDLWHSHRLKDSSLKLFLQSQPAEQIVLFTDGYDTLFLAREMDIYIKYLQLSPNRDIVVSAETNCYPDENLASVYPNTVGSYRFLNSGGIIGPAAKLLSALNEIDSIKHLEDDKYAWSNQYLWSKLYLNRSVPMIVDHQCEIFQTFSNDLKSAHAFALASKEGKTELVSRLIEDERVRIDANFEIKDSAISNLETNTRPLHLHFNGPIMKFMMFLDPFRALI